MSLDWRKTAAVLGFGITKVPLIAFVTPRVLRSDAEGCEILIPLSWRTKNHLGSMYFGALSVGADLAGGFLAMSRIWESKQKIALVFKSMDAKFLKRAEGDVVFSCADGRVMADLVQQSLESNERVEAPVRVEARVGNDLVAEFVLVISLKKKG